MLKTETRMSVTSLQTPNDQDLDLIIHQVSNSDMKVPTYDKALIQQRPGMFPDKLLSFANICATPRQSLL